MLFNSLDYFVFLLIALIGFFLLPHRFRWMWLLPLSAYFYLSWNPAYGLVLLFSSIIGFTSGIILEDAKTERVRKVVMAVGVGINLCVLFVFKYFNFFNSTTRSLCEQLDLSWNIPHLELVLPIGISFYTFQKIAYTVDIYRREYPAERHFGYFLLYVCFFPQLVAGPIERASRLIEQLRAKQNFSWDNFYAGSQKILWGLFKKVVIADRVALYVNAIYNNPEQHNSTSCWLATYAFAIQIYCDFSGYTDIALGSAQLFGIKLMDNFKQPYFATTIRDFWRRWHISLSTWLRDYLYIPLGGSRLGPRRTQINLLITMLLGGLWHGASWNFVIWGGLQGIFLIASHETIDARDRLCANLGIPNWLRDNARRFFTFHLVCLSWVFFRANTLSDSMTILSRMTHLDLAAPFQQINVFVYGGIGVLILLLVESLQTKRGSCRELLSRCNWPVRWACWYAMVFLITLLGVQGDAQFIYFQF